MKFSAKLGWLGLSCAISVTTFAQQTISLPDTKPGQLLSQFSKLCDSPDQAQFRAWAESNLSPEGLQRIGADNFAKDSVSECSSTGGYKLLTVVNSTPEEIAVLALARKPNVYFNFRMAVGPDGKVRGIGSMPTLPPESSLPKDLSDQAIGSYLDSLASGLEKSDQFSGIAIIARGTQPIATTSHGYADRAKKTPITPQTQFTLGSMGKLFTAAAVGQLVDSGKISFDDVVGKFFPDFANKTVREKVTIGMLLSHTSGMGDFLDKRTPEMMKHGVKRASEFVPLFEKDEPKFEPGARWEYSNAGLALAGAIVEKVSGEDYPTYIKKHIFEVAGMKNSDPNNIPHIDPRMVTPYTRFGKPEVPWKEAERDIGSPAGGAISTAEDLIKFADALRNGKLFSKATFDKMAQPHGDTPWGARYGYAMMIADVYGRRVVGHGGGFPGVSTELYIVLDSPYTAVVLGNQDPPAAEMLGETAKAIAVEKAKIGK